jgi:F1F0 ATPase subunit 2
MHFELTTHELVGVLLNGGAWLAAGGLIGVFHFLTLKWNVWRLTARPLLLLPLGIQLIRFGLTAALLTTITRAYGCLALLAATTGILVARSAIIRWEAPL